ncbi:signal peptidase I [Anaeromyxobacter oryzisoli]|uniref:signal peptidase I n=1 Tax=Anaeromyxobacter oryzisoli TaxID=2925408 RepID=UPI001F568CA9|nr:signal peptidase I [Anaeromyxobacter sp. SG63]
MEAAAAEGDPDRLSSALRDLNALWDAHLARRVKPLWREYAESVAGAVIVALLLRAFVVDAFRIPSGSMTPTLLAGDFIFVAKAAYAVRIPFTNVRLVETGAPRRGDVVVFQSPRDPSSDYVKRVIGVPGDVIELREQVLYVNGVPQPRTSAGEFAYSERDPATGAAVPERCRRYREALAKGDLGGAREHASDDPGSTWQAAAAVGVADYDVLQCGRARLAAREGPFEVVRPGYLFVMGDNRDLSADSRSAGGWQVPVGSLRGRAAVVFWSWGEGGLSLRRGAGVRLERLFKPIH